MQKTEPASPACNLHEAPDSYRGYLPAEEIAAILKDIAGLAAQSGKTAVVAKLRAVIAALPPPAGMAPATAALHDPATALDRLLPRVADNRLHAELTAIRQGLENPAR